MTAESIHDLLEKKEYSSLRSWSTEQNEADIAAVMSECPLSDMVAFFRLLPKGIAAEVFSHLPIEAEGDLIRALGDREAAQVMDLMFADDAADLLEEMPASVATRLLQHTSPSTRHNLNQLLKYPDNSAGSIMTVEFVSLKQSFTVAKALDKIREDHAKGIKRETIHTCYVLDDYRHLVGAISLRDLILADPQSIVGTCMEENLIFATTAEDREEVAQKFQKYDYTALPVVDSENRLVGIITTDDIIDVIQKEATEDMEIMAAMLPSDKPYMKSSIFEIWKKRIPWLLLLMVCATFTSAIIQSFESALASQVILIAFIPMLMGAGGNAGGQSSVSIIRSISLGELAFSDLSKVLFKELRIGFFSGVTLAFFSFFKLLVLDFQCQFTAENINVSIIVSITLMLCIIAAKLIGCCLPLLAKKVGLDPAVMASPFITTFIDILTLVIYFEIAITFLPV